MQPAGFPVRDSPLIPGRPRLLFQICWTAGGNSTAPSHWYTLTDRMRGSWKAALSGRQYELDDVEAGQLSCQLDNLDGAFDPDNSTSPFAGYVLPYRRCRLAVMTGPSQNQMWPWVATGVDSGVSGYVGYVPATTVQAASVGTVATASGLAASVSGLTTATTWAVPSGTASGATFGLAGGTLAWTAADSGAFTVTAGNPYSAGVDVRLAAGGQTSLAMRLRITWYTLTGTVLTTASTGFTATTTSTRVSLSATAPAGAMFGIPILVTDAATTAATTVQATAWQWEQAAAATAYADPGQWAQLWGGLVERWLLSYDGGQYGQVAITAVDALAPLSQVTLSSIMGQWLVTRNVSYRWDLGATIASPDRTGGTAFPELGGAGVPLDLIGTQITTGADITSTTPLGTLWGVTGPVTTLANGPNQSNALGSASGAAYLQPAGGTPMLPAAGGWSRLICFRTTLTPGAGGTAGTATLWAATAPGFIAATGDQSGAQLGIYSSGTMVAHVQPAAGSGAYFLNSVPVCDGNWHCAVLTLSADTLSATLTVDGISATGTGAGALASSTYTADAIGTTLTTASGGQNAQPFAGDIAWAAQWGTPISATLAQDITRGFAAGWSGDAVITRVQRAVQLAAYAGAYAGVAFTAVNSSLGAWNALGSNAMDLINEAVATDVGQAVADRTGQLRVTSHMWRWLQSTPLAVFGELTANGEVPYQGDITFEQDPAHLYNDIQITVEGAQDLTDANALQEVQDATSQANYFPQSLQETINPQTVAGGLYVAQYLLSQFKDPHTRLSGLSVNLAGTPSLIAALAPLNFSDLVRVNKRPILAPMKQLDCFIERITWSGDDNGALAVAYEMSPASREKYWIIGAAWAPLTVAPAAGATVITIGPVSGNSAIPAQGVLPGGIGWQMTLGYGTPAAETVTILSVATVAAGYTSVQVTLAAPTANSHAVGDLLCDIPRGAPIPPGTTYPTCYDIPSQIGGTTPLIGF